MTTIPKEQQTELDSALFKKLQQLTSKIPRDPNLYRQDVEKYSKMYQKQFQKLLTDIQRKNQRFSQLLIFLSRCVKHYTKSLSYIPGQVIDLLKNHGSNLHHYVRKKCVGSIMILRAKNILYPVQTIQFLLTLFNIEDKQLRKILYKYILNDIRRMNKHHKNLKINKQIRNFIYENVIKNSDKMTEKSVKLMIDLYKRNIWIDNRSVNIIAEGCFNQSAKIRMISAYFLISTTQPLEQLEQSDSDAPNPAQIKSKKGITKQSKNKEKQIEKQKRRALRRLRKKEIEGRKFNFMPIDIIYNPQDFAEKMFNFMSKKNIKISHKLVYMSLISRLIWRHNLIILPWYGSLIKYMQPKQKDVHKVLTYFAQSVHQNLPDDEVETVIKHIIQKFVNDKCSQFAITIGLNTIRQVYAKLNSIISQDSMLYLATYYEYKNKNVTHAAKALINLVREINPYLLQKKYRGKIAGEEDDGTKIHKNAVKSTIDGAQLLQHKGINPIYMDKILTDEDFKQIRKLKRKRQEEIQNENIRMMEEQGQQEGQGQDEEGQNQDQESENQSEEDEEIDWGDCQEIQQLVQDNGGEQIQNEDQLQQQQDQQDQNDDEQIDGYQEDDEEQDRQIDAEQQGDQDEDEQDGSDQMEDQSEESDEIRKTKQQKKLQYKKQMEAAKQQDKKRKRQKNEKILYQSDDDDQMSEQEQNPHGFISVNQIAFYKKSKTQKKAQLRRNPELKQKFKHEPKQKKGGGTSNRQKQKMKPLLMLRSKKNKIRSQEKQVKIRIKNLKNQLGRVRSGKQAKKLKNKKIVKQPKRR